MPPEDRPYRIVEVRKDGTRTVISDGYAAKAWAFASATKLSVECKMSDHSDAALVDRFELENVRGEPLENYNGDPWLCPATS